MNDEGALPIEASRIEVLGKQSVKNENRVPIALL
jgi:hypothetical protein